MWKSFCSLIRKDCRMMTSGKFFFVAVGSLLLYTLFINFGYVKFMDANANIYNVYLYDPAETLRQVSPLVYQVGSSEELNEAVVMDTAGSGVGVSITSGKPDVMLYRGAEQADCHRVDYALSLLHWAGEYTPETVGSNTLEMKQRREITCELLFIEIVAVGFLGLPLCFLKKSRWA